MTQSENINELLAALAEVQNELPTMPKSSQAYGYKYTDLDTITQTIKPILHNHGVAYMQSVGGTSETAMTLTTRLFHKTGQFVEDTAALPKIANTKNNAKIEWLTGRKAAWRFMTAGFNKRDFFAK